MKSDNRSSNSIINRFRANFQFLIGIVHFFDASWVAKKTTFLAESSVGNSLRFLMTFLITLLSDSMALVV